MATDYLSYFDLKDDPFHLTPDTAYFYNSPEHATALLSLEYCISQKVGFCILTGEPGTGKTTIQRLFTEKWKDRAEIALVMTPRLSADEFFRAVLDDFKIPLNPSKNEMLKSFRAFLLTHAADDKRVAIIVDEAQELPDSTLEELRLLSNMETEKEKLLQIILIGQPELRVKLQSERLRQLNQRISVRVQLQHLTAPETSDYINTRLVKGGINSLTYDQKAKDLIFTLSGGIPRTINLLASRGLMSAYLSGSKIVFATHVQKGAEDVMEPLALTTGKLTNSGKRRSTVTSALSPISNANKSPLQRLAAYLFGLPAAAAALIKLNIFGNKALEEPCEPAMIIENSSSDETDIKSESRGLTAIAEPVNLLELEVGYGLTPMVNAELGGDLLERINFIRNQTAKKRGIDLPPLKIRSNLKLRPYEYNLLIQGNRVGGYELTGQYLAMDSGGVTETISGISAKEPIFDLPAVWIKQEERETAINYGYSVVDSTTVIATHISELIKRHSNKLLGSEIREEASLQEF